MFHDQLKSASNILETQTMTNDPFGRRQKRVRSGLIASTTNYLYDGTNVIQEQVTSVGNATLMVGLRMDEHLARTDTAGNTRYFLTDAQGSTIRVDRRERFGTQCRQPGNIHGSVRGEFPTQENACLLAIESISSG